MSSAVDTATSESASLLGDLAEGAHHLAALGLSPGSSGNVSARVGDLMYISSTGVGMDQLEADGLSVVSLSGEVLDGPKPSKEYPLHLAMYQRIPSAQAVVHTHSPFSVAASLLEPWSARSALPPVTPYFVMRVGQVPLVPYAHPGSDALAQWITDVDGDFGSVLLRNHGSVTSGSSVAKAVDAAIELEQAARLAVTLAGQSYAVLSDTEARELAQRYGSVWE